LNSWIIDLAAQIVPLVFAIVFHEVAHGWTARALGDPTAHDARRLSLNPLRHVDPIGTIVLPGILAMLKLPVFGWAKPVPVDMWQLRNPRFGMIAVAAAGPLSNFLLAALSAVGVGLLWHYGAQGAVAAFVGLSLGYFIQFNVFLALFNLLPVPPFDGSHIVEGLLPRRAAAVYAKLRPFGLGLMMLLLLVLPRVAPGLGIVDNLVKPPFEWAIRHYFELARWIALG